MRAHSRVLPWLAAFVLATPAMVTACTDGGGSSSPAIDTPEGGTTADGGPASLDDGGSISDDASTTDGPASDGALPGCALAAFWTVTGNGGTARAVDDNLLLKASSLTSDPAITVSQGGITGDFVLTISANSWNPGGPGASLEAILSADVANPTEWMSASIVGAPESGVAVAHHAGATDFRASTKLGSDVELEFKRTGANVYATAWTDDGPAQVFGALATSPLRISIRLRSTTGVVSQPTTVEVGNFAFEGTGAQADAFPCPD